MASRFKSPNRSTRALHDKSAIDPKDPVLFPSCGKTGEKRISLARLISDTARQLSAILRTALEIIDDRSDSKLFFSAFSSLLPFVYPLFISYT